MKLTWMFIGLTALEGIVAGAGYLIISYESQGSSDVCANDEHAASDGDLDMGKGATPENGNHELSDQHQLRLQLVKGLVDASWEKAAAEAVIDLNLDWLRLQQQQTNRVPFEKQMKALKTLGAYSQLQGLLEDHPELAGLLAGAAKPDDIARSLMGLKEREYQYVAGLYVRHAAPHEAAELAQALRDNRELICRLLRRGLAGAEVVFIFPRQGKSDDKYEKWLRQVLEVKADQNAIEGKEDGIASRINLLLLHGPDIRRRLAEDRDFFLTFFSKSWPRLVRAVAGKDALLDVYLDDPKVWDLLALDEGEALLKDWGPLAVDLLYGDEAYPKALHDRVVRVLTKGDNQTLEALLKFRNEDLFKRLLGRRLDSRTMARILKRLASAGSGFPSLLKRFDRLSDAALAEEVGPEPAGLETWIPLYEVYYVGRKYVQGRPISALETAGAALDAASVFLPAFKGGKALKGEKVLKVSLLSTARRVAGKQLGEKVAQKLLSEKQLRRWSVSGLLSQVQKIHRVFDERTTLDITRLVQFMFKASDLKRDTYKALTGLEARLFMRGDGRAFIRFGRLLQGQMEDLGKQKALEFISSCIQPVVEEPSLARKEESPTKTISKQVAKPSPKEELQSWRKHVSAWWLMNASDMVD